MFIFSIVYDSKNLENSKCLSVNYSISIKWENTQLLKKNEIGVHVLMRKNFQDILRNKSKVWGTGLVA